MNRPDNYEVEDAFNTLTKAEEIKGNSELLGEVLKYAEKKKAAISSIEDLRQAYDDAVMGDKEDAADQGTDEETEIAPDAEDATDQAADEDTEIADPKLEENVYIRRVERANADSKAPVEIPLVKIAKD